MSELEIELSHEDLVEPNRHRDRVRAVFVAMIEFGLGLTEKDLSTPSNAVVEKRKSLPYSELHEESVSELKLLKAAMKLMRICGLDDFGWKDLHAPTSKRFRKQLSGMINLAKYRMDRLQVYADLNEQRDELLAGLQEVNDENAMLNKHLEETKIDTDIKWKEIEEVETDCEEIEREIAQQNKLQASIRQESTDLKKKANELKDKIATAALALQETQAEERKLSSQVVRSPARIKRETMEATKSLETERKECANVEGETQVVKTKIENVLKAESDVVQATKMMGEVKEAKAKYSSVLEEVQTSKAKIAENERKAAEFVEEREAQERELYRVEEKVSHMRKQGKLKMDAAQDALVNLQADLVMVEKDRREGMARVEAHEAEVRAIEAEIEEEKQRTDSEISEIIGTFEKLEQVVKEQDLKFTAALIVE